MTTLIRKNNYTTLLVNDSINKDFSNNEGYLYINDNSEVIFAGRELNPFLAYVSKDENVTTEFRAKFGDLVDHIQYIDSAWSGAYHGKVVDGVDYETDEEIGYIEVIGAEYYSDGSSIAYDEDNGIETLYDFNGTKIFTAQNIDRVNSEVYIFSNDYQYGLLINGESVLSGADFLWFDDEDNTIKDEDDTIIHEL